MDRTPANANQPAAEGVPVETRVAVAVVRRGELFLVGRRAEGQALAGYAEFPGGKCRAGETPVDCAVRECQEETGLLVRVLGVRREILHDYPHGRLWLTFLDCVSGDATPPRPPFRWVTREQLVELRFPPANADVLAALLAEP
jgi:8-oxo-dGTP diphosphatase